MGWRFIWLLTIERDDPTSADRLNPLVKWVVIGLAALGVAAVIIYRTYN